MEYEPTNPAVQDVWQRLSVKARTSRLAEARRREAAIKEVRGRPADESERSAVKRIVTWCGRTGFRGWCQRYDERGLEGLIDRRIGPESQMPKKVRTTICTLRQIDPDFDVNLIVDHVAEFHDFKTSATTVKRVVNEEGLARRRGPARKDSSHGERRLELGGMKLVEAACVVTGYLGNLATAITEHVEDLPRPETEQEPDTSDRDEYGRFLSGYNERYRKEPGDSIGPGFASIDEKRAEMNPDRLQVAKARPEVLERKLQALMATPLFGDGRLLDLRVPRAQLLREFCEIPYKPATLDRFARELKYAGVSSTLWEIHARKWLELTKNWGGEKPAAFLYIDGTTKAIWTRLCSQSTKVSQVGRIMPGLEEVAFHTGAGVPLWMMTHSGRAPLVKVVPDAITKLEEILGSSSIGRFLVIDAEANSIPFLKSLENGNPSRRWVTRLRDSWMKDKRIFNRTNYRAYRNGDRVRMGEADFNDPEGGKFRMRVVEVERRTKGTTTYLGASLKLDDREWKPAQLADIYFQRWPAQELNFRAVNQATNRKQVHGYGKQLVDNVSVVTELDELACKTERLEERLSRQKTKLVHEQKRLDEAETSRRKGERRQQTVDRNVSKRAHPGAKITGTLHKQLEEQRALADKIAEANDKVAKQQKRLEAAEASVRRTEEQKTRYKTRQEKLESRRKIFAHDVELDSLFSLLKVGLVLLVTYILREYLADTPMEPATFLKRIAPLPARLRKTPTLEILTFEHNDRDPEIMTLLANHVDAINARCLPMRSGRTLRIKLEPPPAPRRPPPPTERVD